MLLPIIRVFFSLFLSQYSCQILMVDTERQRESICAAMCPIEEHGEVPGIWSCTSTDSVNTKPFSHVDWLPLVVCHSVSACLDSQNTGMTVMFSVSLHQCSQHRTHYAHIYNIQIGNIVKGTFIFMNIMCTPGISVQLPAVSNVTFFCNSWCRNR